MARTTRVLLRMSLGTLWYQASEEEKQEIGERWRQVRDEWKADPGIRFVCYYACYGSRVDSYAHHYVFEIDDIAKVHMLAASFAQTTGVPERYSIDIVWGNTDMDQYWTS